MATLQICYLKDGKVVCTARSLSTVTADTNLTTQGAKEATDPDKRKVKDDVGALLDSVLADSPEFFVISYNPK